MAVSEKADVVRISTSGTLLYALSTPITPCGVVSWPNQQRCSSVLERVAGPMIGGDDRKCSCSLFLFQRISVAVQRFNSVSLHDGFNDDGRPEQGSLSNTLTSFCNFRAIRGCLWLISFLKLK